MTAATPGRALVPAESVYLYYWRFPGGEEFGLYRRKEDAEARAAEHVGEGLSEVLSMAVLDRPQAEDDEYRRVIARGKPQPAPELAAAVAEARRYREAMERVFRLVAADQCTCSVVTGIVSKALEGRRAQTSPAAHGYYDHAEDGGSQQ